MFGSKRFHQSHYIITCVYACYSVAQIMLIVSAAHNHFYVLSCHLISTNYLLSIKWVQMSLYCQNQIWLNCSEIKWSWNKKNHSPTVVTHEMCGLICTSIFMSFKVLSNSVNYVAPVVFINIWTCGSTYAHSHRQYIIMVIFQGTISGCKPGVKGMCISLETQVHHSFQ